jgi:hypothetical protein
MAGITTPLCLVRSALDGRGRRIGRSGHCHYLGGIEECEVLRMEGLAALTMVSTARVVISARITERRSLGAVVAVVLDNRFSCRLAERNVLLVDEIMKELRETLEIMAYSSKRFAQMLDTMSFQYAKK